MNRLWCGLIIVGAFLSVSQGEAQIRGVTRRTIQTPLGLPPILRPGTGWVNGGGAAPASAPRFFRVPSKPPPSAAELEDRERRKLDFEIRCAERGLPSFQFSLAGRYLTGRGVPYNPEKALELLRKAAAKDHLKAQEIVKGFDKFVDEHNRKALLADDQKTDSVEPERRKSGDAADNRSAKGKKPEPEREAQPGDAADAPQLTPGLETDQ